MALEEGPPDSFTVFVDETEVDGRRPGMGKLYGYGAVAVPTWWLPQLTEWMAKARELVGVPQAEELKWSPKKHAQPAQYELGARGRLPLQEGLLEAAKRAHGFSVVVIWDSGRDGRDQAKRDAMMLDMLFERICHGVEEREAVATVIFDHKFDRIAPEAQRLADQWSQVKEGTEYVVPNGAVAVPYLSASSEHQPGLQLADLVAGATLSAASGRPAGQDLHQPLLKLARKSPYNGQALAYGLKIFPDSVVDPPLGRWLSSVPEAAEA